MYVHVPALHTTPCTLFCVSVESLLLCEGQDNKISNEHDQGGQG